MSGNTAYSNGNAKVKQLENLKFVILVTGKCQDFANCQACQNVYTVRNKLKQVILEENRKTGNKLCR